MTSKVLQLTFPQWQGAPRRYAASAAPELSEKDAVQGYALGARLMEWLLPDNGFQKAAVEVSDDLSAAAAATENGIESYRTVVGHLDQAFGIINQVQPEKIITLGGDCSVSLAPFSYLADLYGDDLAVVWIDAHHDFVAPFEADYTGFHAMVLRALTGEGDAEVLRRLPGTVRGVQAVYAGLREHDAGVPEEAGLTQFTVAQLRENLHLVQEWLAASGRKKAAVHLDLDVLDPASMSASSWKVPDGLTLEEVVDITAQVARTVSVVGLTLGESLPREALRLRRLLSQLPVINQR